MPGNTFGKGGCPEEHPRRVLLDDVFYLVRGGVAWAQLPRGFPPYQAVYGVVRRWVRAGAWRGTHDALRDRTRVAAGRDPTSTAAGIDSQTVRGADTVPRAARAMTRARRPRGRERHIAVDILGLLPGAEVTGAGIQDRDRAHRLLAAWQACSSTISLVWADSGYTGRLVTWAHKVLSLTVEIVKRTDTTAGFRVPPRRWVVERTFGRIVKHRRCVRDYETLPDHHEAMIHIAMIMTTSRQLTHTPTR
ncbi:IS5-like element ISMac15 family transposase [Amycolatopsis ultiminotia]|uniref:IS5-like element ISMac15 family transposase n=1 Tax=Amycolatopsis ultiminotia TaxID=543629 RepID=A0ABP6V702_9PSEU